MDKIIWVCKEGCDRPRTALQMAHEATYEENKMRMKYLEYLDNATQKDS